MKIKKMIWILMLAAVMAISMAFVGCAPQEDEEKEPTGGGATLESIEIELEPTKTQYVAGETFDPAGMMIVAIYSDDSEKDVSLDDITWDKTGALTVADTAVVISYEGKTAEVAITVIEASNEILFSFLGTGDEARFYADGRIIAGNGGALGAYDQYGDAAIPYLAGTGTWSWDGKDLHITINGTDIDPTKNIANGYEFTFTSADGQFTIPLECSYDVWSAVLKDGVPMPA